MEKPQEGLHADGGFSSSHIQGLRLMAGLHPAQEASVSLEGGLLGPWEGEECEGVARVVPTMSAHTHRGGLGCMATLLAGELGNGV